MPTRRDIQENIQILGNSTANRISEEASRLTIEDFDSIMNQLSTDIETPEIIEPRRRSISLRLSEEHIMLSERRIRNLGSTYWLQYVNSTRDIRESLIVTYSSVDFAYLDYSGKKESNINSNKYFLAEDGTKEVKKEEVIYISGIGNFMKDDNRLHHDFIDKDRFIIIDKKYLDINFHKVYTDIDKNGILIHNEKDYTAIPNVLHNYPMLLEAENKYVYFTHDLLNNTIFRYKYHEDCYTGIFYSRDYKIKVFKKHPKIQYRKHNGTFGEFSNSIINKPNTSIGTYGMKYSFGIEIETISGLLPKYLDHILYYSAVHDGSLRDEDGNTYGGEYISDVLKGDLGLKQLKMLSYELTKRCLVNKKCGNHVHLSGVSFNKENIVLMYYLYYKIQIEIFDMMPKSRRNNEYCRYLDNLHIDIDMLNPLFKDRGYYIDKYYNDIILFLSKKGCSGMYINKKKDHPKGFKCAYDHSASRYCWVNFVPAVFNTRGNEVYTINSVAYLSN